MRSLLVGFVILGLVGTVYAQPVDFTVQYAGGGTSVVYDPGAPAPLPQLEIWVQWDYSGGATVCAGADTILTASAPGIVQIDGPLPAEDKSGNPTDQSAYDTTDYVAPLYKAWDTLITGGTALDFGTGPMDPSSLTIGAGAKAGITAAYHTYYLTTATGTISDTHVRLAKIDISVQPGAAPGLYTIDPTSAVTMQIGPDATNLVRREATSTSGVTLEIVPEPATALLLIGALPFLRRRR